MQINNDTDPSYDVIKMHSFLDALQVQYPLQQFDRDFLLHTLRRRMIENACILFDDYIHLVKENKQETACFIESLNIGYSEFFRNQLTFAVLETILLPSLALKSNEKNRKELRIWSAACADGQEAYSLAILLEEMNHSNPYPTNYRIFATDYNPLSIDKAAKGVFPADALNNITRQRINKWFNSVGDHYIAKPELKKHIEFSVFDLLDNQLNCPSSSIFGDFDVVFCANLLFYFKSEYQNMIIDKSRKCLADGGYIITDEAERSIFLNANFIEAFPQSAIFKKKKMIQRTTSH